MLFPFYLIDSQIIYPIVSAVIVIGIKLANNPGAGKAGIKPNQ
jgi:hypothetical protein